MLGHKSVHFAVHGHVHQWLPVKEEEDDGGGRRSCSSASPCSLKPVCAQQALQFGRSVGMWAVSGRFATACNRASSELMLPEKAEQRKCL